MLVFDLVGVAVLVVVVGVLFFVVVVVVVERRAVLEVRRAALVDVRTAAELCRTLTDVRRALLLAAFDRLLSFLVWWAT